MIYLNKMSGGEFVLNAKLIETVDTNPDTTITTTTGKKYIVKETVDEVVKKVKDYEKELLSGK